MMNGIGSGSGNLNQMNNSPMVDAQQRFAKDIRNAGRPGYPAIGSAEYMENVRNLGQASKNIGEDARRNADAAIAHIRQNQQQPQQPR
ncbi:hypothetical protein [Martelella sp. HB161492]|uniref:hypothetical protein n=1 Tax=Martelella sp. HB161492 TaxID=2720726 RepID=UPI0015927A64|nr:hypothetical protein [Martelella sp. HB161492]